MARTAEEKAELKAQRLERLKEYRNTHADFDCCTVAEAAGVLGISKQAIYKQIAKSVICCNNGLVDLGSLEAYIKGEGKSSRLALNKLKEQAKDRIKFRTVDGKTQNKLAWDFQYCVKLLKTAHEMTAKNYLTEIAELVERITRHANKGFVLREYTSWDTLRQKGAFWAYVLPLWDNTTERNAHEGKEEPIIGAFVTIYSAKYYPRNVKLQDIEKKEREYKAKRRRKSRKKHNNWD